MENCKNVYILENQEYKEIILCDKVIENNELVSNKNNSIHYILLAIIFIVFITLSYKLFLE